MAVKKKKKKIKEKYLTRTQKLNLFSDLIRNNGVPMNDTWKLYSEIFNREKELSYKIIDYNIYSNEYTSYKKLKNPLERISIRETEIYIKDSFYKFIIQSWESLERKIHALQGKNFYYHENNKLTENEVKSYSKKENIFSNTYDGNISLYRNAPKEIFTELVTIKKGGKVIDIARDSEGNIKRKNKEKIKKVKFTFEDKINNKSVTRQVEADGSFLTIGFDGEYTPEPHAYWDLHVSLPINLYDNIKKRIQVLKKYHELILTFPLKKKLSSDPDSVQLKEQDFKLILQKK